MILHNPTTATQTIVAASSDSFASVEFHQTVTQDGMMRMERMPHLQIKAGETVQLAPGGLHLMLMQPATPTKPGELRYIEIEFADGSRQGLQLTVRK